MQKRSNSPAALFKLPVLFSVGPLFAGVFLTLFATASPRTLTRPVCVWREPNPLASPRGGAQEAWAARYNGTGNGDDALIAITVEQSGDVYVTGSSLSTLPDYDYATIKYNSGGQQQWVSHYGRAGNDSATATALDQSGNVYVTGGRWDPDTDYDFATIKYNSAGEEQWVARYNGPSDSDDDAFGVAIDGSGNVYVTGGSTGGAISPDYATIKYDSAGNEIWVVRYDAVGDYDYATAIVVDDSGNVYVTGDSIGADGNFDYATIKYSFDGLEQWVERYDGPGNSDDFAVALGIDNSGNVYVTGQSPGAKNYDGATIKYDSFGQTQWEARYNGPANLDDYANDLAVDSSGNIYVTGGSVNSKFYFDFVTIKYGPAGQEEWIANYDGPANLDDSGTAITADSSGSVYVTGGSTGSDSGVDYATVKYVQGATPTPTPTATEHRRPPLHLESLLHPSLDPPRRHVRHRRGSHVVNTNQDLNRDSC
jgi:Beta-propeller repeat